MTDAAVQGQELTIITGMSGAGRSTAAKCLEDLGYFVMDNIPPALIPKVVELGATGTAPAPKMALVTDVRGGAYFDELERALDDLDTIGLSYHILFLDAAPEVLVRRFEEVRRPHPLNPGERVIDAIETERSILEGVRARADLLIDTSEMNVHQLRHEIREAFGDIGEIPGLQASVVSFGYKYGIPIDADIVLDCRFLPNPHWIEELRPLIGTDEPVREYVLSQPATKEFLARLSSLIEFVMPEFAEEGKAYLTIAVGCTGGRHRSVVIAEEIAQVLRDAGYPVRTRHRDVVRGTDSEWKRPPDG